MEYVYRGLKILVQGYKDGVFISDGRFKPPHARTGTSISSNQTVGPPFLLPTRVSGFVHETAAAAALRRGIICRRR